SRASLGSRFLSSRPLTYAPFGPVPTCQAFHAGRDEVDPLQVAGLRARGFSWNQIAHKLEVGRGMAERAFRTLSQKPLRLVMVMRYVHPGEAYRTEAVEKLEKVNAARKIAEFEKK